MRKLLSLVLVTALVSSFSLEIADAATRLRRSVRVQPGATVQQPQYYTPYQQTAPQYTGNVYYYSTTPQPGYTYYSTPIPGYYLYGSSPVTTQSVIEQGRYYYSSTFVAGYTYYSTPVPGYYYYLGKSPLTQNPVYNPPYNTGNAICIVVGGVYQCTNNTVASAYGTYPGCSSPDILIGGQMWASCNATDLGNASSYRSGWFFAGDTQASFASNNDSNAALEWLGTQTRSKSWSSGPCASGYRLPNRGEWQTVLSYARANSTTVASMLSLPQNGGYQATRNTNGDVVVTGRLPVAGSYWSSTYEGMNPIVMHIGSTYGGYNTTSTEYGYMNNNGYQWTYTDTGLELIASTTGELANVRCIRN